MVKKIFQSLFVLFFLATSVYGMGIRVTWAPNSEEDLAGYKVYYGNASGSYTTNVDVGNICIYDIKDVPEKTTYYIAVTAYDTSGNESGYSQEAFINTPDITPPGIPGVPVLTAGIKCITVSWQSVVGAEGYKIYYKTGSGSYGAPIDAGAVTNYKIDGLADNTVYFVKISAYDEANNESDACIEASIKTLDTTAPAPPSKPNLSIWDKIVSWLKKVFRIS